MPKLKTKSSTKGRFDLTASGKVKRKHANHNHQMRGRSKRANVAARSAVIAAPENAKHIKSWMPYAS